MGFDDVLMYGKARSAAPKQQQGTCSIGYSVCTGNFHGARLAMFWKGRRHEKAGGRGQVYTQTHSLGKKLTMSSGRLRNESRMHDKQKKIPSMPNLGPTGEGNCMKHLVWVGPVSWNVTIVPRCFF